MSVSSHLVIDIAEYDSLIRTFIPDYEEMLDIAAVTAATAGRRVRTLIDLGTGTGALASRVAGLSSGAAIVAVDEDEGMLKMAARRLRRRKVSLLRESFLTARLRKCDAITASFALHHIASRRAKKALFATAFQALRAGGVLVSADCHPPRLETLVAAGRRAWRDHLARFYGPRKAEGFLRAWSLEDFYLPLEDELVLMKAAGFRPDVVWRKGWFAVIAAAR